MDSWFSTAFKLMLPVLTRICWKRFYGTFFSERQVWVLLWEIQIMCASHEAHGLALATAETDIETR